MSLVETDDVERGESISLHRRILSDIREKILSGAWAPGHRIPFEHARRLVEAELESRIG